MRLLVSAALVAVLFATNLLAAESVGPLASGKPAGVGKAQDQDNTALWILGGAAAIGVIVAVAGSGSSSPVTTPPTAS